MEGFDAEQRSSTFIEDEEGFPMEGSLLDVTDKRTAELHWRRVEEHCSGSSVKASAAAPAIAAPCKCRAFTTKGKPCNKKVSKLAGSGDHRAHTCSVHKHFVGALQPMEAPEEVLVDVTDRENIANFAGKMPLEGGAAARLLALEKQKARAAAREADERRRSKERLKQSNEELEAELRKLREERDANLTVAALVNMPASWTPMTDPTAMQMVPVAHGSAEWIEVATSFSRSALSGHHPKEGQLPIVVTKVERVQNQALWQHFALKRREIMKREKVQESGMSRYERTRLWHGTDEATAHKIANSGFNRSFAGKNATRLGKGVYFARHAAYSVQPKYPVPDAQGQQRMFSCRVLVGEYALGACNIPAPPERRSSPPLLYDSTVGDNLANPHIFVTFHDAQAYPEYLITFKSSSI